MADWVSDCPYPVSRLKSSATPADAFFVPRRLTRTSTMVVVQVITRVLTGIAFGFLAPATTALVVESTPPSHRGRRAQARARVTSLRPSVLAALQVASRVS
jgi:MFS family permease